MQHLELYLLILYPLSLTRSSSGQWTTASGGTILACQDSLSRFLSKTHNNDSADPGPHGFLYVEYTISAATVPSLKTTLEHDDIFRNSFGYTQDVHVTIQPFDLVIWCPLLYTATTVFETFTSAGRTSVGNSTYKWSTAVHPSEVTHQNLTNLPEVNLKLRGVRLIFPSSLETSKQKTKQNDKTINNNSDLLTIEITSLVVISQVENPISRLILDKKLGKALTSFACSHRGSASEKTVGDTQYKIEVIGLRVWSGRWEELCRMLPNQDTSCVERDLLEQNPALEWNTYTG